MTNNAKTKLNQLSPQIGQKRSNWSKLAKYEHMPRAEQISPKLSKMAVEDQIVQKETDGVTKWI